MKICENCGKEIAEDSVFCPYCGTRQKMTEKENRDMPDQRSRAAAPEDGFEQGRQRARDAEQADKEAAKAREKAQKEQEEKEERAARERAEAASAAGRPEDPEASGISGGFDTAAGNAPSASPVQEGRPQNTSGGDPKAAHPMNGQNSGWQSRPLNGQDAGGGQSAGNRMDVPYGQPPQNRQPYNQGQGYGQYQPNQAPYGQYPGDSYPNPANDSGSIGWFLLGFFIPIVGIILYFVWRKSKPKCARMAGIGGLTGMLFNLITLLVTGLGTQMFSSSTSSAGLF